MKVKKILRNAARYFLRGPGKARRVPSRSLTGDLKADLRLYFPGAKWETVLDVGANRGQSVRSFLRWFPEAEIYAIEPSLRAISHIEERFPAEPRLRIANYAMGPEAGHARMSEDSAATDNRVVGTSQGQGNPVQMTTGDSLRDELNLDQIDFLKIDTEGHDLGVLEGFTQSLTEQRIRMIQVEASMNETNSFHVPLAKFTEMLSSHGFLLFGIYEQTLDFRLGIPVLRRGNAVFVRREFAERFSIS